MRQVIAKLPHCVNWEKQAPLSIMVEIQTCPSPIFMSQMSSREIAEYVSSENPAIQGSSTYIMAVWVVQFSSWVYKIEKIYA